MSFKYDPKDAVTLIPDGTHDASIKAVIDRDDNGLPLTSKKGNEMIRVAFEVYVGDRKYTHYEYFVNSPGALWRYRVLAKALGQGDAFKAGTFDVGKHIGDNLLLEIATESDPQYGDKNVVSGMFAKGSGTSSAVPVIREDEIPF